MTSLGRAVSLDGLLLLSEPEGKKTTTSYFHNLKTNSGNITLSVSRTTETSNEDFVIFINKGHTTITRYVGSNSLVVFFELNSYAFTDGRVGLLSFDCNLFYNNTCSESGFHERFLPF